MWCSRRKKLEPGELPRVWIWSRTCSGGGREWTGRVPRSSPKLRSYWMLHGWKLFYHNYYIRFQWKFFYQTSYTKFPMKTCLLNKLHQISNENLSTQKIYQFTMNAFLPSKLHQIFKENSFSKLHQISNENFCAKWIISNSQRKLAVIYRTELTCRPSALNLHMWEMIQAAAICRLGAQVFSISQRPYSK